MIQPLTTNTTPSTAPDIIYPDSDGQPMADNTKQFRWIVVIKENLELLFADRPDVFVAGDLLWYPIEGNNTIRLAPDTLVAFGRPKGDRGSYKQWEEDGVAPQVVFEVLSPGNRLAAMAKKLQFYKRYGVEEYYVYDPDDVELIGWLRSNQDLEVIEEMSGWVSPRLQIRFEIRPETLQIYRPDGEPFLSFVELAQLREQDRQRADAEQQRADAEQQRADAEQQRANAEQQRADAEQQRANAATRQLEAERQRNELLAARLRELGINPEEV